MTTIHHTAATHLEATRFERTVRSRAAARVFLPAANAIRLFVDGLFDGIAAYREFEQRKSWGTPHDTALRKALGPRVQK